MQRNMENVTAHIYLAEKTACSNVHSILWWCPDFYSLQSVAFFPFLCARSLNLFRLSVYTSSFDWKMIRFILDSTIKMCQSSENRIKCAFTPLFWKFIVSHKCSTIIECYIARETDMRKLNFSSQRKLHDYNSIESIYIALFIASKRFA